MPGPTGIAVARRWLGAGVLLAWLGACSARAPVDPQAALEPRRAEIEMRIRCGSHHCLTGAVDLALEWHRQWPERLEVRREAVRAALLLALREKQLGILGDGPLTIARDLLEPCEDCDDLRLLAEGVQLAGTNAGGVHEDLSRADLDWRRMERTRKVLDRWRAEQPERLRADPAAAAFCLGLALPDRPGGEAPGGPDLGVRCGVDAHGESPLVLFSRVMAKAGDPSLARQALSLEPSFQEAHLLIGHGAKAQRRLGEAEDHYRRAFEALPRSVAAGMALADLSFALEAWPQALGAYDQVAMEAPEHREAHLRRGIVLTFLDRPREAVAALRHLVELGFWFLGEAHYWLARNKVEMDLREEAVDHLEQARHYLPDDPRVYELSGRLAFRAGAVEAAESDYLKVMGIDARWPGRYAGHEALCGSLSGLARIASAAKRWPEAAGRFEQEGECQGAAAELVSGEIATIRTWGLSPTREARQVARKERVREGLRLRKAAALYNAAACAFNDGQRVRATGLAERAAEHPDWAEKADELITRILAPR